MRRLYRYHPARLISARPKIVPMTAAAMVPPEGPELAAGTVEVAAAADVVVNATVEVDVFVVVVVVAEIGLVVSGALGRPFLVMLKYAEPPSGSESPDE